MAFCSIGILLDFCLLVILLLLVFLLGLAVKCNLSFDDEIVAVFHSPVLLFSIRLTAPFRKGEDISAVSISPTDTLLNFQIDGIFKRLTNQQIPMITFNACSDAFTMP